MAGDGSSLPTTKLLSALARTYLVKYVTGQIMVKHWSNTFKVLAKTGQAGPEAGQALVNAGQTHVSIYTFKRTYPLTRLSVYIHAF